MKTMTKKKERLIRIEAPHFVAGLVWKQSGSLCAPIIHYMRLWSLAKIFDYCKKKKWTCSILTDKHR